MKTYSKTDTLGNGNYTGQKRLVADALLKSDHPLASYEIAILAILDGAYFKTLVGGWQGQVLTIDRGGGAQGVIASIEYHLKQLLEMHEIIEHP